jgi:arylsulfatase A-like enzyme
MLGDHRLMSKVVDYEESVTVPCLLRLPRQRRQMIVSQRVSQVDLAPTLLELMVQPVPAHLQGRSMAPCLREDGDWPARDVIIEFVMWPALELRHLAHGRTIITQEGWKLSANEFGGGELYNLRADPQEMANLFPRAEYRPRVEELAARLRSWQRATGDRLALDFGPIPQWPAEWIETLRKKDVDFDRDLNQPWPDGTVPPSRAS